MNELDAALEQMLAAAERMQKVCGELKELAEETTSRYTLAHDAARLTELEQRSGCYDDEE